MSENVTYKRYSIALNIYMTRNYRFSTMKIKEIPCLLMDQDKMNNLYRGPSIDASYQIAVHLGKRFQRRRFFLEINQSETITVDFYKSFSLKSLGQ
jgi:hypothetical protein